MHKASQERKKRTAHAETAHGLCAHPECAEPGLHRAPKSPASVNESTRPQDRFQYFCLDHVREYNKQWDFFAHMTPKEVEAFQRDAITGHRKTKPVGLKPSRHYRHFTEYLNANDAWFLGFKDMEFKKPEPPKPTASKKERWAMAVFNLDSPFSHADVKTRYRQLAHQYHPDKHGGDVKAEEKFKEITEAYSVLKNLADGLAFA